MTIPAVRRDRPRRLLICDDDPHVLRLIQVNLERQGHQVTCARDGAEAITILESVDSRGLPPFDRIVVDALMPRINGYGVLEWIRTHADTKHVWVAIMLPLQEDLETWEGLPFRADLYIAKPFNPIELVS